MDDVERFATWLNLRINDDERRAADVIMSRRLMVAEAVHMSPDMCWWILRGVGAAYADHPEMRQEWRP